ncbi:hypothetical protein HPOKI112_00690 [Helicobacter pylori oki112]|uniref:hypothetical protein n=1 Tax=Helicobacter pylori TaxID=210 RepID=UPI00042EE802|nr:hypothetical protein [Helicobacter pylori]AHN36965.1 hypothetical protein HPOKI112_00690 [Helicobacter pylori oki112]AHN38350.1 hypothetical protein HPOKI128_00485 [Helicobacter pylori oki128]
MVKERLEEARNSPKGNFYFFLPLLWGSFGGLWLSFIFCFFVLSCFIKISILMYNNHSLSIVLKGQRE